MQERRESGLWRMLAMPRCFSLISMERISTLVQTVPLLDGSWTSMSEVKRWRGSISFRGNAYLIRFAQNVW